MLANDPKDRPTAEECLKHSWFNDDQVILNNLIHLNDFLSNAKAGNAKVSTLIHASVSSFNLMHLMNNLQNMPEN